MLQLTAMQAAGHDTPIGADAASTLPHMNALLETYRRLVGKLTPLELAARELTEAELRLLEAQSAVEYAQSVVAYNQARIKRLKAVLCEMGKTQSSAQLAERGQMSQKLV